MDNPRLEINNQRFGKQSYSSIPVPEPESFKHLEHRAKSTLQLFVCSVLFMFIVLFGVHSFIASDIFQTDSVMMKESFVDLIKDLPSSQSIHEFFEHYASYSQLAGNLKLAKWTRDQFQEFGLQNATIETYYPYLNYPVRRELAIISGPQELLYQADLSEPQDSTPAFHAFSGSGNVTGPIVYVNYGRLEDFSSLISRNIELSGTIALIRHGAIPASIKVQHAETFGCIGVLIYTDPSESTHGKNTFGPNHVQRDTVQYGFMYPGDPFSPGEAVVNATRNATLSSNLPHIPSLPIAWSHALPLLRATQGLGVVVDPTWIGGFDKVSYYSGPSVALVNLVNLNEFEVKPIYNVLAHIEGNEEKEKAVIIGNHRDAWDNGSVDPSSGSSVMLEVARVLGILVQNGWKPRRTIVFASWDANEYGNIGSTENVEAHLPWLDKNAIAYLNIDHAVTGSHFSAQASPLLQRVLYQVASSIINPRTSESVYDTWLEQSKKKHFIAKSSSSQKDFTPPVLPVGSTPGLDTTAFFQHAGISSLSMAFTNGDYGVSRSTYDSVSWMEEYGDPTFEYHQTMVRLWGLLAYRLSSELIIPMNPLDYALTLQNHVTAISVAQNITFDTLSSALHDLHKTSVKFDKKMQDLQDKSFEAAGKKKKHKKFMKKVNRVNERLVKFERAFVQSELLVDRPWYKHAIYGPSAKTGLIEAFPSLFEIKAINETEIVLSSVLKNAQTMLEKGKPYKPHLFSDNDIVL